MSSAKAWPPAPPIGMWTPSLTNHSGWTSARASQSATAQARSAVQRVAISSLFDGTQVQ
jgi:hypothetical protein